MGKESKRTEGEWEVKEVIAPDQGDYHIFITDKRGDGLAEAYKQANADFIVKAVNNHDKLVEALRDIYNKEKDEAQHEAITDGYARSEWQPYLSDLGLKAQKALKEVEGN